VRTLLGEHIPPPPPDVPDLPNDESKLGEMTLTEALAAAKLTLAETKTERTAAIARIESEKGLAVRLVEENVRAQKDAQKELSALIKNGRTTRRKRPRSAKLLRPVAGPIVRYFGTVKDKNTGAKVTSNGVEIKAALGTKVKAPEQGTVAYQGFMRGFGLLVILDVGDKTHVLLGHLSRASVQTGDVVTRGQTLGFVGDTASADGAKLYVEVRRNSRPVNPLRYIGR